VVYISRAAKGTEPSETCGFWPSDNNVRHCTKRNFSHNRLKPGRKCLEQACILSFSLGWRYSYSLSVICFIYFNLLRHRCTRSSPHYPRTKSAIQDDPYIKRTAPVVSYWHTNTEQTTRLWLSSTILEGRARSQQVVSTKYRQTNRCWISRRTEKTPYSRPYILSPKD